MRCFFMRKSSYWNLSSIKQDSERIEVFEAIFSLTAIEALMESSKKIQTDFDADRKVVFFLAEDLFLRIL